MKLHSFHPGLVAERDLVGMEVCFSGGGSLGRAAGSSGTGKRRGTLKHLKERQKEGRIALSRLSSPFRIPSMTALHL